MENIGGGLEKLVKRNNWNTGTVLEHLLFQSQSLTVHGFIGYWNTGTLYCYKDIYRM
jgi:hypothetical protein